MAATPRPVGQIPVPELDAVDWSNVLQLSEHHRLRGLLCQRLEAVQVDVPEAVLSRLRSQRLRAVTRELAIRRELNVIGEALAESAVLAMAMKGAALIDTVYKEPGLRPMIDLDLLVEPDGIDRATQALGNAGYRPVGLPRHLRAYYDRERHQHRVPLVHDQHPLPVELHERLILEIDPVSTDQVFARSAEGRGGSLQLPDPTDLLLQVAFHFARDRRGRSYGALCQLADLAYTIDRQPIDWEELERRSCSYGLSDSAFAALYVVSRLGVATVPVAVLAAIRPRSWNDELANRLIFERVLADSNRLVGGAVPPSPRWFFLPGRQHMRARYNLPDAGLPRLYLKRARVALGMLAPTQFTLNRWLRRVTTPRLNRTPSHAPGTARRARHHLRPGRRARRFDDRPPSST